jgi:hypothetical protein
VKKLAFLILPFFILSPIFAYPHSGRTNADGCHTNRKTGEYHCHNKKKSFLERDQGASQRYNRKNWKHWIDADRDCQDTRQEILIRDSLSKVKFKIGGNCRVDSGSWVGPYTGKKARYPKNFDIDHIVPLGHAYAVGGKNWSKDQKKVFANDFENLLVTDSSANRSKGKKAPHQWMPPNTGYHCEYVSRWVAIKRKYRLSYMAGEKEYIEHLTARCPQ